MQRYTAQCYTSRMSSALRARPTMYRGVRYRSRLEATWAAFFDLAGIKFWYEGREDLAGWIPDFEWDDPFNTLVEVKPARKLEDFEPAIAKAAASGHVGLVLFLGVDPSIVEQDIVSGGADAGLRHVMRHRPPLSETLWPSMGLADPRPLWAAAQNATQWRAPR